MGAGVCSVSKATDRKSVDGADAPGCCPCSQDPDTSVVPGADDARGCCSCSYPNAELPSVEEKLATKELRPAPWVEEKIDDESLSRKPTCLKTRDKFGPSRARTRTLAADRLTETRGCTSLREDELAPFQIVVDTMWPWTTRSIENLLTTKLEQEIHGQVSELIPLASFKFTTCEFGNTRPVIQHISTRGRGDTVQFVLDLVWDATDAHIAVQVGALHAGLKGVLIKCSVLVGLAPLLEVLPIVGGVSVTFPDPPDLKWHWTGIGRAFPQKLVKTAIEDALVDLMVLPYMIFTDITPPDDRPKNMDQYSSPAPLGVLRVELVEASDLRPADINGLSDPYVVIKVGRGSYRSPVKYKILNPQWDEFCGADFMIFNMEQKVKISVFDSDSYSSDDHLGSVYIPADVEDVRRCPTVAEMMEYDNSWWPLDISDYKHKHKYNSQLRVHCKFMRVAENRALVASVPVNCPGGCGLADKAGYNSECSLCNTRAAPYCLGGCGGPKFKTCRACRFAVCEDCVQTQRPACGLLQITLIEATIPQDHAEAGGHIVTLKFEGVKLTSPPALPEWGDESWQITKADAARNLHKQGGMHPSVIARCLESSEAEIEWMCAEADKSPSQSKQVIARSGARGSAKRAVWDHNYYFLVKNPNLDEAKLSITYEEASKKTTLTNEMVLSRDLLSKDTRGDASGRPAHAASGFSQAVDWALQSGKGKGHDVSLKLVVQLFALGPNLLQGPRESARVVPRAQKSMGDLRCSTAAGLGLF